MKHVISTLGSFMAACLLCAVAAGSAFAAEDSVRLSGNEAVDTSSAISSETFTSSSWAILARDDDYADAMSATGLAGVLDAPVILTDRHGLSDAAKTELSRLGVQNVYVVGGNVAMPGDFESELRALGISGIIERVYGNEYYDTSVKCAQRIAGLGASTDTSRVIVAYGENFQDALSISSYAYKYHVAILLQTPGETSAERGLSADEQQLLSNGAYANAAIYVPGGPGAVSTDSVEGLYGEDLRGGARIYGQTGYGTSNAIAEYFVHSGELSASTICFATGALDAKGLDALSGSALAGKSNGVILLVSAQAAMEAEDYTTVEGFLTSNAANVTSTYLLGGTYVLPDDFKNKVDSILNPKTDPDPDPDPGVNPAPTDTTYSYANYDLRLGDMIAYQRTLSYTASKTYSEFVEVLDPSLCTGTAYYQFMDLREGAGLTGAQLNAYINTHGSDGVLAGKGAAFVEAAKEYGLNEAYLVAHTVLESGWGKSRLANGTYYDGHKYTYMGTDGNEYEAELEGYEPGTYYNLFGIGAYDTDPSKYGFERAIEEGWDSIDDAIYGAAKWISENYVYRSSYAQHTLYEMKWDVERSQDTSERGYHQYATDIYWAQSIGKLIANVYSSAGVDNPIVSYIIPVYRVDTIADGLYTIGMYANSDYVLDISGGSSDDGANVDVYETNGTWAQKFQITMVGDYCVIENLKSGKVLDCADYGASDGTNVQQWTNYGLDGQLWSIKKYEDGTYGFQSKLSGLYLDVVDGTAANGQNVQIWTGYDNDAQKFYLSSTDRDSAVVEGAYVVYSALDGKAVEVTDALTDNGAQLSLHEANDSYEQKFKLLSVGDGYGFVNVHSGKYIDVDTSLGGVLQQWDRTAKSNQQFAFVQDEGGDYYYIKSLSSGQYLTNDNGQLLLSNYTGNVNQRFSLTSTTAFKVYLDAGHGWNSSVDGEYDVGATANGYQEASLTAELTGLIAQRLDAMGVEYEFVQGQSTVNYRLRQTDAKQRGCSTFLAIHFNAGGGTGTESYIHSYNAAAGASTYQSILHPYLVNGTSLTDRGMKSEAFAVCGGTLPSVLCEICFIDNTSDMTVYQSRKSIVAEQIAMGVKAASLNSACGWY